MVRIFGKKDSQKKERMYFEKKRRRQIRKLEYIKESILEEIEQYNFYKTWLIGKIPKKNLIKKDSLLVHMPEELSLSKNPDTVINILKQLIALYKKPSITSIFLDYSNCKNVCLSASSLIRKIVLDLKRFRDSKKIPLNINGKDPKDSISRFLVNIEGIKRELGYSNQVISFDETKGFIEEFRFFQSKPKTSDNGQRSNDPNIQTTKLVDFFISSFEKIGFSLNPEGETMLARCISEVLDNCDIHPFSTKYKYSQWFVNAFFYVRDSQVSKMSIIIFNFGQSIFESMKNASLSRKSDTAKDDMFDKIDKYYDLHKSRGFSQESLWTIYSLQEKVSSYFSSQSPDRGTGTVEFIRNVQSIVQGDHSDIALISGGTLIKFPQKYKMKANIGNREILAFNQENSLSEPPDMDCILKLKYTFPGTMYVINFTINKTYLSKNIKGEKK